VKSSAQSVTVLLAAIVLLLLAGSTRTPAEDETPSKPPAGMAGFSKFISKVEREPNALEVTALFTLGAQSNGINPLSQDVSLKVGDFSATIPAGSFKASSIGWFKYEGTINGVDLEVKIVPLGANRYGFRAEAVAKGLTAPTPGETHVELSIDGNHGRTTAKVERSWI
jgi:hypothetical protein